jgi:Fic family protein
MTSGPEGALMAPPWPEITYETVPWSAHFADGVSSRTARRRHAGPYQAAVVPPIADSVLELPAEILTLADDASQEVARFDAELGGEIAPFVSVLLRSEAAASSQIENLTASARAIAEAELGASGRRNADQIVANVRAMAAAGRLADRIDADSVLAMHRALMEHTEPRIAGRWRDQQVWIGGTSLGPHQAEFVPPQHTRVEAAIEDLIAFVARDDLPLLAQAAVAHAQFESIHPFPDGNGRTGRALLHAMLRNKGLTRNVTVPVSAGLLVDTAAYFAALRAYQRGDPQAIVERLAGAYIDAVISGRDLVTRLRALHREWSERLSARRDSAAWRVLDVLLRHPVVNAPLVADELGISLPNVYRPIEQLVADGVLVPFADQRRNRAWRSPEVLDILDEFAAGGGRRSLP